MPVVRIDLVISEYAGTRNKLAETCEVIVTEIDGQLGAAR